MELKDFNTLAEDTRKLGGQKMSLRAATPQEKNVKPEFKGLGIRKYSYSEGTIYVKTTSEIANSSTGLTEIGVSLTPVRESHYNDVAHNGLCSELKSNPAKKYILIKFSEIDPDAAKHTPYYMDDAGKVYNPKVILKPVKEPGTIRGQLYKIADVAYRPYGIENISRLKVAGYDFIDNSLIQYDDVLGTAFAAAL